MVKFLYILVSKESDIYYEQTLVSILSLRHYNPDAFVTLLVDDKTDANLMGFRAEIKTLVNEYKVVSFDDKISGLARSRLLKTNMRNLLEGDFLYIDGDTAIADKLDLKVDDNCDVGAIADLHARENDKYHVKHKKNNKNKNILGFTLNLGDLFFNGGIIFARDNDNAKRFFDKWHELYQYCNTKGIFTDQISFNETNRLLGFPMKELPGEWNCQVREAYNHLYRVKIIYPMLCAAKIIHFFGSGIDGKKEPHPLMKKSFFEQIKAEQKVSDDALQVIYNAKTAFFGAPAELDPKIRFPRFFIFRQFPLICKLLKLVHLL
jgi:hypothetical protein